MAAVHNVLSDNTEVSVNNRLVLRVNGKRLTTSVESAHVRYRASLSPYRWLREPRTTADARAQAHAVQHRTDKRMLYANCTDMSELAPAAVLQVQRRAARETSRSRKTFRIRYSLTALRIRNL